MVKKNFYKMDIYQKESFLNHFQKQKQKKKKKKQHNLPFYKILIILFFSLILLSFLFIKKEKPLTKASTTLYYSEYEAYSKTNSTCDVLDPINLIKRRIDNGPIEICEGKKSKHVCYQNVNNYYDEIYAHRSGIFCEMENIVIDPSNAHQSGLSFLNGPVDSEHYGFPILNKGFINAECKQKSLSLYYNQIYQTYFNSWNYEYNSKDETEELEELAPGKIIFFISRNQDSPNLFHGNSEVINALAVIYLFNLNPKDIQVIFLESIEIPVTLGNQTRDPDKLEDPFYYIYKNIISQGGEPLYKKFEKKI